MTYYDKVPIGNLNEKLSLLVLINIENFKNVKSVRGGFLPTYSLPHLVATFSVLGAPEHAVHQHYG